MPGPYHNQLLAISKMIKATSKEIKREGYDLLFRLWRENADSTSFIQDLMPTALEYENLVQELRNRLNELSIKDTITNTFLKDHLEILASEVSAYRLNLQKEQERTKGVGTETGNVLEKRQSHPLRSQKIFLVCTLGIVVLISLINLMYVVPKKDGTLSTGLSGLELSYRSPTYLSVRDENTIEFSIENFMQTEFEGTVTLVFHGPKNMVQPARDQKLSAEIDVHPQDKESKQFRFLLVEEPIDKSLDYHFQFTRLDGSHYESETDSFLISPIPYLRSASNWLFGTLGALIVTSLWDQIKKMGEGAIQKLVDQLKSAFLPGSR